MCILLLLLHSILDTGIDWFTHFGIVLNVQFWIFIGGKIRKSISLIGIYCTDNNDWIDANLANKKTLNWKKFHFKIETVMQRWDLDLSRKSDIFNREHWTDAIIMILGSSCRFELMIRKKTDEDYVNGKCLFVGEKSVA